MSYQIFGRKIDGKWDAQLFVDGDYVINGCWILKRLDDTKMYYGEGRHRTVYEYIMEAPAGEDYNEVLDKAREIINSRYDRENRSQHHPERDRIMDLMSPQDPKHPRFEVEDVENRRNYTFVLEGDSVAMYNTSRGAGNPLMEAWTPALGFPFDQPDAAAYYKLLYNKSLTFDRNNICFIGYVDKDFRPIEEQE